MKDVNETTHELTQRFDLLPFDLDKEGRFPLHQIVTRLTHTAGMHADHFGFGIAKLNAQGLTWMLHRLSLRYVAQVDLSLPIDITTGVLTRHGMTTLRYFIIRQDGADLLYALTNWVGIDLSKRAPVRIDTIITNDRTLATPPEGIAWPEIPRRLADTPLNNPDECVYEHVVRYSDLDINAHVNSSVWVKLAMDALTPEEHQALIYDTMDLHFNIEAAYGASLRMHKRRENNFIILYITDPNMKLHFEMRFRLKY